MFEIPDDRRYMESHEWTTTDGDTVRIGISDFAQDELGDVVTPAVDLVEKRVERLDVRVVCTEVDVAGDENPVGHDRSPPTTVAWEGEQGCPETGAVSRLRSTGGWGGLVRGCMPNR